MIPERLLRLQQRLEQLMREPWHSYEVPGRWVGSVSPVTFGGAPHYLHHQLERILQRIEQPRPSSRSAVSTVVYNGMVRHITAWQHGPRTEVDGWCSDGSFAKLTALLPYLADAGVTVISLLPILDRGVVGRKGTLGSPYAARHPVRLDPSLAEPALGLGVDEEFRTFVDACHALDVRVVVDVVLRTASIDSDLVPHHPEWFYWVDEQRLDECGGILTAPALAPDDLQRAKDLVEQGILSGLPTPPRSYVDLFTAPPRRVERDERGWLGVGANNRRLRIPGAFADWPPDDPQPAWSDVTYLRLHDHVDFRYMAYNTVRMFERNLERPEYRHALLWNLIAQVIPHFVRVHGVDGAMIDMGHALPADLRHRVIAEARHARADVLLWEENFTLGEASRRAGYDATLGYLPFDAHDNEKLRAFIHRVASGNIPLAYLATPESHNTPRSASREGGIDRTLCVWTLLRLLPKGIPFLHAGMELGETTPVNTGLGFTTEELDDIDSESLPLFSSAVLPWQGQLTIIDNIAKLNAGITASEWHRHTTDDDVIVPIGKDAAIGYLRYCGTSHHAVLVLTWLTNSAAHVEIEIPDDVETLGISDVVSWNHQQGLLDWQAQPYGTLVLAALVTNASRT